MIGKLKGVIDDIGEDHVLLDVAGVGYIVFCSSNSLRSLPNAGEVATLFIETHVREDHIHLYGFATMQEKKIFLDLLKVSGVGAKMALAILSTLLPDQVISAIVSADKAAFKPVSGVGPKLADRLITELKGKYNLGVDGQVSHVMAESPDSGSVVNNNVADAIMALTGLGYSRSDAYNVVHRIAASNDNSSVDNLIKESLKQLSGGN